jgi:hypothetical protein
MQRFKEIAIVLSGLLGPLLLSAVAQAQFGFTQLPRDDFTWHWGDPEDIARFEDFMINGTDGPFRCELTGKLSPASRLSRADVQNLEADLRGRLDFVQAAAEAMYYLDVQRELDWATLACTRPDPSEVDPEEKAEREARAKEKALREQARRRERQTRAQENAP